MPPIRNPSTPGVPSSMTRDKVEAVCLRMSGGDSLRKACELEDIAASTFLRWVFTTSPDQAWVAEQYERARQMRTEILLDQTIEIADDADAGNVQVARLRCDVRDRALARMSPRRYADLKKVEHSGAIQTRKRIVLEDTKGE